MASTSTTTPMKRRARRSLGDEEAGKLTPAPGGLGGSIGGSSSAAAAGGAAAVPEGGRPQRGDTVLSSFMDTSATGGSSSTSAAAASYSAKDKAGDDMMAGGGAWWWRWRDPLLSLLLAVVLFCVVPGRGDFRRLEMNGFALCAATAPGSHWGNWRSLTRCDCKAFHHCYAKLSQNETTSRTMRLFQAATCQLLTGQDDECQIGHSQLRKDLVKFRFFIPELVLRLRLAADFSPWVTLICYWLMACALLEIIFFLTSATRLQWRRLRARGMREEAIWEQEALVWLFLVAWHETLSYLVHYVYWDSHTLCDGTGLFFRDAMTAYTLIQVVQRVILGGGPRQHRDMLLRAEQRFLDLEGRPLWLRVVKDPRIGAFHSFSGLDLKIVEDPVGFFTSAVSAATRAWQLLMRLIGPAPPVEGLVPAPAVAAAGAAAGRSQYQGRKHD